MTSPKNTPPDVQRIAEEILLLALDQTKVEWNEEGKKKLNAIVAALVEYGEICSKNSRGYMLCQEENITANRQSYERGFKDALEEAAKIAELETKQCPPDAVQYKSACNHIVNAIRSLIEKGNKNG